MSFIGNNGFSHVTKSLIHETLEVHLGGVPFNIGIVPPNRTFDVCKVEASMIDQVHLSPHWGTYNADMDEICCWSLFCRPPKLRFMWWWLMINYHCKSFDN